MWLQVAGSPILWLHNISLHFYTTISLSIHPPMGTWAVSVSWVLGTVCGERALQMLHWHRTLIFFRCIPRRGTEGSLAGSVFSLLRNELHTAFHYDCTIRTFLPTVHAGLLFSTSLPTLIVFIHLSIYLSTYPPIHLSCIHPSIHPPSIYPSI